MAKEKKFRLIDAILSVITVVFVAEAAAPAAAIGNSQFFWWIFLIIAFLLPYGLVVSELGTTYDDEGGLYDWVRRAFGDKWASACRGITGSTSPCGWRPSPSCSPRRSCSSRAWNWDFCPRF